MYILQQNYSKLHHYRNYFAPPIIGSILIGLVSMGTWLYFYSSLTWYVLPAIVGSILYSIPFLFGKNLRSINYLKPVIIALVWVYTTHLLPCYMYGYSINWVYVLVQFLWFFLMCIPLDINNMPQDKGRIQTIPLLLGEKHTVLAMKLGLVSLTVLLLIAYQYQWVECLYTSIYILSFVVHGVVLVALKNYTTTWKVILLIDGLLYLPFIIKKLLHIVYLYFGILL